MISFGWNKKIILHNYVLPVIEVISQLIIILPVVWWWRRPGIVVVIVMMSWWKSREQIVHSSLSFRNNLTVSWKIFPWIIWHSSPCKVKVLWIFYSSVNKVFWLSEHEMISKRHYSVARVVIPSPSAEWKVMLPHKRISLQISPLLSEAPLHHAAPSLTLLRRQSDGPDCVTVSTLSGQLVADRAWTERSKRQIVSTLTAPDITTLRGTIKHGLEVWQGLPVQGKQN